MLTSGIVEQDREKSTGLDERLFELAVRINDRGRTGVREAAAGRESDMALHPLASVWKKAQESHRREAGEAPDEQQLHDQRVSTLGLISCGLAHDLNNMLTIIINNAAIAMLEVGRDGPGYEAATEALRAAEKAKGLTNRILKFGGNHAFDLRPTNINDLINDMLGMMKTMFPKKVLKRIILDPQLPFVNADPEQILHALMNLVTNAIDAMPDGGMLTITTRCVSSYNDPARDASSARVASCQIQIADTGSGIPEQEQEDIFKPFFTTKQPGKGTGLGLPIAASIIEKHDGKISIRSDRNQGTCVHICIPFA